MSNPDQVKESLAEAQAMLTRAVRQVDALEVDKPTAKLAQQKMFEGLELSVSFIKRLGKHRKQKQNIADWLLDPKRGTGLIRNIPKGLFCESGTTFFYLVQKYLEMEKCLPKYVSTNHKLVETAWATHSKVFSLPGRYLEKYMGDFPFGEDPNDMDEEEEIDGYEMIRRHSSRANVVLATCSAFSFIAGPLVGSRENALTKCAMYQGRMKCRENQQFVLLFSFDKIVPVSINRSSLVHSEPDNCVIVNREPESLPKIKDPSEWHKQWDEGKHRYATRLANWRVPSTEWLQIAPGTRICVALPDARVHPDDDSFLLSLNKSKDDRETDERMLLKLTQKEQKEAVEFLKQECKRATTACRQTVFGKRVFEVINVSAEHGICEIHVTE